MQDRRTDRPSAVHIANSRFGLMLDCSVCFETSDLRHITHIGPDNDLACHKCVRHVFKAALENETNYPPRWGSEVLNIHTFHSTLLTPDFIKAYQLREEEYLTPPNERVHCSWPKASKKGKARADDKCDNYLGARFNSADEYMLNGGSTVNICPTCSLPTCMACIEQLHDITKKHICTNFHAVDSEADAFDGLMRGKDYQICPSSTCGRRIQLTDGCNHIMCMCGMQFCFVCGEPARSNSGHWGPGGGDLVKCPRWNQPGASNAMYDDGEHEELDFEGMLDHLHDRAARRNAVAPPFINGGERHAADRLAFLRDFRTHGLDSPAAPLYRLEDSEHRVRHQARNAFAGASRGTNQLAEGVEDRAQGRHLRDARIARVTGDTETDRTIARTWAEVERIIRPAIANRWGRVERQGRQNAVPLSPRSGSGDPNQADAGAEDPVRRRHQPPAQDSLLRTTAAGSNATREALRRLSQETEHLRDADFDLMPRGLNGRSVNDFVPPLQPNTSRLIRGPFSRGRYAAARGDEQHGTEGGSQPHPQRRSRRPDRAIIDEDIDTTAGAEEPQGTDGDPLQRLQRRAARRRGAPPLQATISPAEFEHRLRQTEQFLGANVERQRTLVMRANHVDAQRARQEREPWRAPGSAHLSRGGSRVSVTPRPGVEEPDRIETEGQGRLRRRLVPDPEATMAAWTGYRDEEQVI